MELNRCPSQPWRGNRNIHAQLHHQIERIILVHQRVPGTHDGAVFEVQITVPFVLDFLEPGAECSRGQLKEGAIIRRKVRSARRRRQFVIIVARRLLAVNPLTLLEVVAHRSIPLSVFTKDSIVACAWRNRSTNTVAGR